MDLRYVQISPLGISLYYYLLNQCDNKQEKNERYYSAIKNIGNDMMKALSFIHMHMVCHNDVSDKNIVIKDGRPVLIDFGCAAQLHSEKTGFVGTTEFAHRTIHTSIIWHCKKRFDFASLGFALATILNGGVVAWTGLSSGPVAEQGSHVFGNCISEASKIIQGEVGLDKENCKFLLEWISLDEK